MQHLTTEALARLLDEPPGGEEAAHLETCAACQVELEALRRQSAALGRLADAPHLDPPEEAWTSLEARLRRERLLGPAGASGRLARGWRAYVPGSRLLRIAAALLLYAGGAATGLALRPALSRSPEPAPPSTAQGTPAAVARSGAGPARPAPATAAGETGSPAAGPALAGRAPAPASRERAADLGTGDMALGAGAPDYSGPVAAPGRRPRLRPLPDVADATTPEEAIQAVRAAENRYLQAYARYTELTGAPQADDPVARAAALESIVLITRPALDHAPADPVINAYHLTAVAQRDAALRQIALRANGPWY
jgi:hypothetical protein